MTQAEKDGSAESSPWTGHDICPTGLVNALIGAPGAYGAYDAAMESFPRDRLDAIFSQSSQMSEAAMQAVTIVGKLISFRDDGYFNDYELTKAGRAVAFLGELAEVLRDVANNAKYFAKKQEWQS
jgi:hypothetical protein